MTHEGHWTKLGAIGTWVGIIVTITLWLLGRPPATATGTTDVKPPPPWGVQNIPGNAQSFIDSLSRRSHMGIDIDNRNRMAH